MIREIIKYFKIAVLGVALAMILGVSFEIVEVTEASASSKLNEGDTVILNRIVYAFESPKIGDFVIIEKDNDEAVWDSQGISIKEITKVKTSHVCTSAEEATLQEIKGRVDFRIFPLKEAGMLR